jgi:hypothetical protein
MYDNDTGEITRPDIPATRGSSPGDGDVRSSGFHERQERELAPYTAVPVTPSRLSDPTVPDAALRMSMARAEVRDDHTPSDVGRAPGSGPRHHAPSVAPPTAVASTVPPPGRTRSRRSPPPEGARERSSAPPDGGGAMRSAPPDSARFGRVTAKATPAALREPEQPSLLRAFLLVTGTAVVAAMLGVGFGNGSIQRLFSPEAPEVVPQPVLPVARVASARVAPAPVSAPLPRAAATDEARNVPVLRIDQLPPGEASATPDLTAAPKATTESTATSKATPKAAHQAHR